MKKFTAFKLLFKDPIVRNTIGALGPAGALAGMFAYGGLTEIAAGIGFLFLALLSVAVFFSLKTYGVLEEAQKNAFLHNWVAEANSPAEKAARLAAIAEGDDSAFEMAGVSSDRFTPHFNIDGTPMAPGKLNLDVYGNAYGMPDSPAPQFNTEAGTFSDPIGGYDKPFGLDT